MLHKGLRAAVVTNIEHPTGLGTVRCLASAGVPVIGVARTRSAACARTRMCKVVTCGDDDSQALIEELIRVAKRLGVRGVLFPCSDQDVLRVSEARDVLAPFYELILPARETVNVMMSKLTLYRWAEENGFDCPRSWVVGKSGYFSFLGNEIPLPCVTKPGVKTSEWEEEFPLRKVVVIRSREELERVLPVAVEAVGKVVVQEWIEGSDDNIYFCMAYCDRASEPVATLTARKIRQWPPYSGTGCLVQAVHQEEIRRLSSQVLKKAAYVGIGSVEFKLDERSGRFKLIEVTVGRPDLEVGLAASCGVNIPLIAYRDVCGEGVEPINRPEKAIGVKWLDEWADLDSARYYIREGRLSRTEWLLSLRGTRAFALLSLRDPLPFVLKLGQKISGKIRSAFKAVTSAGGKTPKAMEREICIRRGVRLWRNEDHRPASLAARAKTLFRDPICCFLFVTGIYRVTRFVRDLLAGSRNLTIIAYHKINNDRRTGDYVRPHVMGVPVGTFARQMEYLKKRHSVILLEEAVLTIKNGGRLPRNAVCITFDDGYRDNYTNAYPILRLHHLPATFFLTTGFIGCRKPAWQVALSAYLRLSSKDVLFLDSLDKSLEELAEAGRKALSWSDSSLRGACDSAVLKRMLKVLTPDVVEEVVEEFLPDPVQPFIRLLLRTPRERAEARELLTRRLRTRPEHEIELLLDILRVRLGLKGAIYVPFGEMMSWRAVRDMAGDGMCFGAHTCAHPILTRVPRPVAKKEVIESKRRLESVLRRPVRLFCYPNGMPSDFDAELAGELKKAGFLAACSMIPGTNRGSSNLFALKRVGPNQELTLFAMRASGILR